MPEPTTSTAAVAAGGLATAAAVGEALGIDAQALLWANKHMAARQWNRVAFCVICVLLVVIAGLWEGK